jgi:hypothetical protein
MAYQTGIINYKGSFKSIRNYTNVGDPTIYASEKGGANRNLILNNPVFARTRENMNELEAAGLQSNRFMSDCSKYLMNIPTPVSHHVW